MLTSNGYTLDESDARLGELASVPDAIRHDRDALWARLRRDGYLLLRGQLDPALVEGFRVVLLPHRSRAPGSPRAGTDPGLGLDSGGERRPGRPCAPSCSPSIVPGEAYAALCATPGIRDWFAWFLEIRRAPAQAQDHPAHPPGRAGHRHLHAGALRPRLPARRAPTGCCRPGSRSVTARWSAVAWCICRRATAGRWPTRPLASLKRPAASMTADLPGSGRRARQPLAGHRLPGRRRGDPLGPHGAREHRQRRPPRSRPAQHRHPLPAHRGPDRLALAERLAPRRRAVGPPRDRQPRRSRAGDVVLCRYSPGRAACSVHATRGRRSQPAAGARRVDWQGRPGARGYALQVWSGRVRAVSTIRAGSERGQLTWRTACLHRMPRLRARLPPARPAEEAAVADGTRSAGGCCSASSC